MGDRRIRLVTRVAVYGFLAVFLTAGLAGVEAWPLTGWNLFSRVRTERQAGWQAVSVDASGTRERAVPFEALPRGYRGGPHLFAAFASFPPRRREAACRALAGAVRRHAAYDVAGLRIYRTARVAPSGRVEKRVLRYHCAAGSGR